MPRYLSDPIKKDLKKKIILLTGPRQSGKTTLAKSLGPIFEYLNYDLAEQRIAVQKKVWNRDAPLLILDELHKMPKWKSWLKGIYDTESLRPPILVTGSAKLDTYKKVGDSLAGRFFQFRMHPFDLKELVGQNQHDSPDIILERLLLVGGFPEPYFEGTESFYNRWKKSHLDIILKQDLIELESVQQIIQIETLVQLLRSRVGSPVSYSSLAEDLHCSDKTVKSWLTVLENMYVVFKITPYHKNISRSLLKQPKYYFFDNGQVQGDVGARFENLVACALLKEIQFRSDALGEEWRLHYLKDKSKNEIDFFLTKDGSPPVLIEVKWSDDAPGKAFKNFAGQLSGGAKKIQLVKTLAKDTSYPDGVVVKNAAKWLARMEW